MGLIRGLDFLNLLPSVFSPLFIASYAEALDTRDFYPPFWAPGGKQFLNANTSLGEPLNVSKVDTPHERLYTT